MDGLHVGAGDLSTASSSSVTADLKRRLFMLALLCGTWVPLLFFTVVGSSGPPDGGVQTTRSILLFLGLAHVPATLLLYLDRAFLRLVRENWARYVYLPIALIIGSGVVFTYGGPTVRAYLFLGFVAWQAHHYGRQNVGVYSFAARAHGWRPETSERWALELATACAICGTFKVLGSPTAPSYLHGAFDLLHRVGYGAFMAVVIFSVYTVVKHRREFPASKAVFFFT
jgi:hypothetical protein